MKIYILNLLIAIDQLINSLFMGYPDETISSRAYRSYQDKIFIGIVLKTFIDLILWFDKDHCKTAYEAEIYKRQYPRDFK